MEYKKEYLIAGFPLIKFHNKDIIEKTQKGSFYMNSLKYYRDIFDKCGDEEIGDPYEGKWYIHEAEVICPQKSEYNQLIRDEPISTVRENDFVYCMLGVNPFRNDMNMFAFSNLQKEKWTKTYDVFKIYSFKSHIKIPPYSFYTHINIVDGIKMAQKTEQHVNKLLCFMQTQIFIMSFAQSISAYIQHNP